MVKRLILGVGVLGVVLIQSAYGIEQKEIKQLTEVMVIGCSLGQKIDINLEGGGELSFIVEKGGKGTFKVSKSEIPSIIDFLLKEEAKERQADKTRECMQKYMDKIFDAVLVANSSSYKKNNSITREHKIDETYDDHELNKSTKSYSKQFSSEYGYKITHYEWIESANAHVSDFRIETIDNGKGVRVYFKLTCGPAYDRWRGWLEGRLITIQEPYRE